MHALTCADCATGPGPGTEFRALPDGLFACPADHPLAPQDIDLDGPHVWAVDASGLGYVTDPAHALEQLGEAIADLGEADEMPDPEYGIMRSLRNAVDAFGEYTEAFRVGSAPVAIR
ncbi:hypothetical protein ABZ619_39655 [Streptomyces sp. NPDC007851]|uniref:hypothetical protein n=1 Tax=Streptomyces sp. NPDC007851 TaxID=3155008 RepID=UPI0033D85EF1